jgi:hypothetical protein
MKFMNEKRTRASGAGVKPEDLCEKLERKQVRLDPETVLILSRIGKKNLSLGIREAARRVVENDDDKVFSLSRHEKRSK